MDRLARKLPVVGADAQAPHSVLSTELGRHRRFASLAVDLEDFRRVREEHGGTVNDVILACIAGGIRGWMLTRAEPVTAKTSFRAMVPMSVVARGRSADVARLQGARAPAVAAGGGVQPGRAAAPGLVRAEGPPRDGLGGGGQQARQPARLRDLDVPRRRRPGRRRRGGPRPPDRHHERAGPAGPALPGRRGGRRGLPVHPAERPAGRCRSASRRTTARCSSGSSPTAMRYPMSTSWRSASMMHWSSWSNPSMAAGVVHPGAASVPRKGEHEGLSESDERSADDIGVRRIGHTGRGVRGRVHR